MASARSTVLLGRQALSRDARPSASYILVETTVRAFLSLFDSDNRHDTASRRSRLPFAVKRRFARRVSLVFSLTERTRRGVSLSCLAVGGRSLSRLGVVGGGRVLVPMAGSLGLRLGSQLESASGPWSFEV